MPSLQVQIAHAAAALVADEGLDYGAAKQRALRQLGLPPRTPVPGNLELEDAVREHLALFCADTQPQELAALRALARHWMHQLQAFSPQLSGAVWRGTATRNNDIHLQLYTDDGKGVEWWLIDQGLRYQAQGNEALVLSLSVACTPLRCHVGLHLHVQDPLVQRGSRSPDARGLGREGSLADLERLLAGTAEPGAAEPVP